MFLCRGISLNDKVKGIYHKKDVSLILFEVINRNNSLEIIEKNNIKGNILIYGKKILYDCFFLYRKKNFISVLKLNKKGNDLLFDDYN